MDTKQISKNDILELAVFELIFSKEKFSQYQDEFIENTNKGIRIEEKDISIILLDACFNYCEINFCKKSAFCFFIILFILRNYNFDNEEDREYFYFRHYLEFKNTFYYSEEALDDIGREFFINFEFIVYCFELLFSQKFNRSIKAAFSYGIFFYVKEVHPIISRKANKKQNPKFYLKDKYLFDKDKQIQISKEKIIELPGFKNVFDKAEFADYLNTFTLHINKGVEIEEQLSVVILIIECFNTRTVNFKKKIASYFFLTALILVYYKFKSNKDKDYMYYSFYKEIKEMFLYSGKANAQLGILYFSNIKFLKEYIGLLKDTEIEEKSKYVFSYAIFLFEKDIYPIISRKVLKDNQKYFEDCLK